MKIKCCFILPLLLLTSFSTISQNSFRNKKVGITFSPFGDNEPVHFTSLEGAASYDSKSFYTFGINYIHPVNRWLDIETGVEYAKHTVTLIPNLPPNMDRFPYNIDFSLINIPITARANFLNYFFANGGLLLGIDASTSSPINSGLGAIVGIGAQYEFSNKLGVFINPYAKAHALIPFSSEKYPLRLLETGIKVGLTYNFTAK